MIPCQYICIPSIFLIGFIFLVLYVLDVLSIIAIPLLLGQIYVHCNASTQAKVISITNTNTILCNIEVQVGNWTSTVYDVSCALFTSCNSTCTALIKYNHIYKNESSCFTIVTSKQDIPQISYDESVFWLHFFYTSWIFTFVVAAVFVFIERMQRRIAIAAVVPDKFV